MIDSPTGNFHVTAFREEAGAGKRAFGWPPRPPADVKPEPQNGDSMQVFALEPKMTS
jgi:hypothetical protein